MTDLEVSDIATAAFEGGSNYWIEEVTVRDGNFHGAIYASGALGAGAVLMIRTSDGIAPYALTRGLLIDGVRHAACHRKISIKAFLENYDASDADLALQYALFGRIVYG